MRFSSRVYQHLTDKSTRIIVRVDSAGKIIPVTRSLVQQRDWVPNPHVAAWLPGLSIRFSRSPELVDWNWVVRPNEIVDPSIPLESDPNLFQRWRTAVNQLQHKLVFIKAIDLHQFSSRPFAVGLGLMPIRNVGAHDVTVAFELLPTSRAINSWFRPTAEAVSAFGQHRKFPAHERKNSGTQGTRFVDYGLMLDSRRSFSLEYDLIRSPY